MEEKRKDITQDIEEGKDIIQDTEDKGPAMPEASCPEGQEQETEKAVPEGGRKRHPFGKGLLCGLLISLAAFILYRGYIDIPFINGSTLTLFLPTYYLSRIVGDDDINYREVERKMKEIDRYLDEYYYYEKDTEAMEEGAAAGMLYGLMEEDPYVAYFTADDFTDEMSSIEGNYCGIGVTVMEDADTGGILVIQVTPDGPAEEAGVRAGDLIVGVDGTDIRGLGLQTVTSEYIKGPEDTYTELDILRDDEELTIRCQRRIIENISVHHSMITYGEEDTKVGYICIASFENNTDEQFDRALTELMDEGASGIVLDLRDDLGGAVGSAVNILDRIIADDESGYAEALGLDTEDGSLLLYQQDKAGNKRHYRAVDGKSLELPLVVLVNENSASASEIVTGVLKDYGYRVIGMNTYGKGIIQSIIQLSDGSAVEFTTAEYILPSGYSLHKKGIAPDVEVAPDEVLLENGANMDAPDTDTDNQLRTAVDTLLEEIRR